MQLLIGNIYTKVDGTETELDIIKTATKIDVKYYAKQKGAKHGEWKQREVHYFRHETSDFPTGLLPRVCKAAQISGAEVSFEDVRDCPSNVRYEEINLTLPPLPVSESDYSFQEIAVEDAVKMERGLMHYPTGSGKTVIMARIINRLKKSSLIIVPNLTLLNQTVEKFQEYFGDQYIGMLGAGKRLNIKAPIVVATQQTLYSLFKQSEVKKIVDENVEQMRENSFVFDQYFKYFSENVPACVTEYRSEYFIRKGKEWRSCDADVYDSASENGRHERKIPVKIDLDLAIKAVKKYKFFGEIVDRFDLMFIDECHHVATSGKQFVRDKYTGKWIQKENLSNTWWNVAMAIGAYYRFGMSATLATPDSPNDQFILESTTGRIISSIGVSELIKRNVLCPVDATMIKLDLPKRNLWATKYSYEEIEGRLVRTGVKEEGAYEFNILNNSRRNDIIIDLALKRQADGQKVLIIVDRIKDQGRAVASGLGDNCVFLTGGSKKDERKKGLNKVLNDNKILIGTIFKEGFDMPAINTLIMAGGGRSIKAVIQKVGRVLRMAAGKTRAELFDFYDADDSMCEEHSEVRKEVYESEDQYRLVVVREELYEKDEAHSRA